MEFFNDIICILLVITITIVFIKTIYSKSESFNVMKYESKDSNDIANRLLRDPDIIDSIRVLYNKEYTNTVVSKQLENKELLDTFTNLHDKFESVPRKYTNILDKYNDLNSKYKLKKKEIEAQMITDLDNSVNIDSFNKKNLLLKNKLRAFTDSFREALPQNSAYNKGKIIRNRATNNELTLVKNNGDFSKYQMFNDINDNTENNDRNQIYYLPLNNDDNQNEDCLASFSKENHEINACLPNKKEQFFLAFQVNHNEMYNRYIKLSGNFSPEHLVDILDTSIKYPFYIISPFNIPGYAVVERNKKIYIQPVRNDPYQQFNEIFTSSVCEINND